MPSMAAIDALVRAADLLQRRERERRMGAHMPQVIPGRLAMAVAAAVLAACAASLASGADFRVTPYLQNPTSDAVTIRWLSDTADPGSLVINGQTFTSSPTLATSLDYQAAEPAGDRFTGLPWLHSVRVTDLAPSAAYSYSVSQGATTAAGSVVTPVAAAATTGLAAGSGVRLFVYSDTETEPESVGSRVSWSAPVEANRPAWVGGLYPATQTVGYAQNLAIVADRAAEAQAAGRATMIAIPGDLVESGGEPLLALYDVAAVFSGHDEMYEHSIVDGIHFYDVGASGDGLRGPQSDLTNPFQTFLAHADAPEVWAGDVLVSGGKHYGDLEIDVTLAASGIWDVSITPAYAFPLLSPTNPGVITGWERRAYDDVVTFSAVPEPNGLLLPATLTAAALFAGRRRKACGDRTGAGGCEAGVGRI